MQFEQGNLYDGPFTTSDLREAYLVATGRLYIRRHGMEGWESYSSSDTNPVTADRVAQLFTTTHEVCTAEGVRVHADRIMRARNSDQAEAEKSVIRPLRPFVLCAGKALNYTASFLIAHAFVLGTVSVLMHAIFGFYLVTKEAHFLFPKFPNFSAPAEAEAVK